MMYLILGLAFTVFLIVFVMLVREGTLVRTHLKKQGGDWISGFFAVRCISNRMPILEQVSLAVARATLLYREATKGYVKTELESYKIKQAGDDFSVDIPGLGAFRLRTQVRSGYFRVVVSRPLWKRVIAHPLPYMTAAGIFADGYIGLIPLILFVLMIGLDMDAGLSTMCWALGNASEVEGSACRV